MPRDIALRSVAVGDQPLRLNTEPVPPDVMPLAVGDHAARIAAAIAWLEDQCGDYAPLRRRFIGAYFRRLADTIEQHRAELTERLRPYDGLYAPEDFLWSALRPLPRGWLQGLPSDFVFWDGTQAIAVELSARETDRLRALQADGIAVYRDVDTLPIGAFWDRQTLPASPFRRLTPPFVIPAQAGTQGDRTGFLLARE